VTAVILQFPCRGPGLRRTVAETIALRLVESDRDLANAIRLALRDGRLLDQIGSALGRVLDPKAEPRQRPFTAAVQRALGDRLACTITDGGQR
jgi:hypothetical protein